MVEIIYGIGFGDRSGAIFKSLDVAGYGPEGTTPTNSPQLPDFAKAQWSPWGDDNLQPVTMRDHLENCGVLNAGVNAKSLIAAGVGVEPFLKVSVDQDGNEQLEWCSDSEIHDWLEENEFFQHFYDFSNDDNSYGWNAGRIILNKGRDKINRLSRIDVFDARLAKKTGTQLYSSDLFLCNDWTKSGNTYDTSRHARISLLQEYNEINDLNSRLNVNQFEYAFINRVRRNGHQYYANPLWWSAQAWVQQARSIPSVKNALFKNQILLRYVVTIHPQYWEDNIPDWNKLKGQPKDAEAAKKAVYDRIDLWLSGELNSGKSLFNSGFFEKATGKFIPYIQVEAIDDKFRDGKLLPDSAAANSEILFALMINPALMGAGQPGGAYSNNAGGSNVRESFMVQMMLMNAQRKMNTRMLNVVKKFNGWSNKLEVATNKTITSTNLDGTTASTTSTYTPRLVFRILSGLLTTLDTGKSTKNQTVG